MNRHGFALLLYAIFPCAATATVGDVSNPLVEAKARNIIVKYGREKNSGQWEQGAVVGGEFGLTSRWATGFALNYVKQHEAGTELSGITWENKFLLRGGQEAGYAIGMLAELEFSRYSGNPHVLTVGPLLEKQLDQFQLNANLLLQRQFRNHQPYGTELLYQWQVQYPVMRDLDAGLQGFGEVGKWNDWSSRAAQRHQAGPTIAGKIELGSGKALGYRVSWLTGLGEAAPDHGLRLQVEYGF